MWGRVWGRTCVCSKNGIDIKGLFFRFDSSPATTALSYSIYLYPQRSKEILGLLRYITSVPFTSYRLDRHGTRQGRNQRKSTVMHGDLPRGPAALRAIRSRSLASVRALATIRSRSKTSITASVLQSCCPEPTWSPRARKIDCRWMRQSDDRNWPLGAGRVPVLYLSWSLLDWSCSGTGRYPPPGTIPAGERRKFLPPPAYFRLPDTRCCHAGGTPGIGPCDSC